MEIKKVNLKAPLSLGLSSHDVNRDFRLGKYGLEPNKEVVVYDHFPDDPSIQAVVYVGREPKTLVVPIPTAHDIFKRGIKHLTEFYSVEGVPQTAEGDVDYVAAYQEVAKIVGMRDNVVGALKIRHDKSGTCIHIGNEVKEFKDDGPFGWFMAIHQGLSFTEYSIEEMLEADRLSKKED